MFPGGREKPMNEPEKVLLCRTDRLGDVILALPCAALIKRMFPESRVGFLVREYTAPIVELCEPVDDVIRLSNDFSLPVITDTLKDANYDTAVVLFPHPKVALALFKARIPIRAGTAYRWCSIFFNRRHREHRKDNIKHEVEYNLTLTYAAFNRDGNWKDLLSPDKLYPMNFRFPESVQTKIDERFPEFITDDRTVVAIHPGGSGSAHRWEVEKYALLARRLAAEKNFPLIITGTLTEEQLCLRVERSIRGKVLNLCEKLTLPELAVIYRRCRLLITNSTGPLHLGRAVGTPVLGLFPSNPGMSPVRWGPYGLPNNVLQPPDDAPINQLDVETVYRKILTLLND
jgi:ADP-heptose:LPS heptosyltransferase